jgi:hypothetical protein
MAFETIREILNFSGLFATLDQMAVYESAPRKTPHFATFDRISAVVIVNCPARVTGSTAERILTGRENPFDIRAAGCHRR